MKKLLTLPTALLLVVILFISGCTKKCTDGTCCDEWDAYLNSSPYYHSATFEAASFPPQPERFYYYYPSGLPQRVQFFLGRTNDDICTGEHLNIHYTVETTDAPQTRPLKIFGEMYWSVFGDDVILFDGIVEPTHTYSGMINDLGLKQAFPEGAAEADLYITVEFESLGNFALDTAYFTEHILMLEAKYDYKKF